MRDYFHNNDRIPVDSCPESDSSEAPYTELTIISERMLEVDKAIWEALNNIPMPYNALRKVRVLICDAYDDGHKNGYDEGRNH